MFDGLSGLTLNIQEATQDSDLIFVNPFYNPEISQFHGVQTGITAQKRIPILGQLGDIGHIDPGSCGTNSYTGSFPVSEKTWNPILFSERIALCADDVPANLKFWRDEQVASKRWENISRPLEQYVLDITALSVARAITRLAEFADSAAEVVGSGGYLTAGSDKTLFTAQDGQWKQIFTDGAGAGLIPRYTIDANSAATKALQLALADDAAYNVFQALIENMTPEAIAAGLEIECTKTLWDNYVRFMQKNSGAFNPEFYSAGYSTAMFGGYKVNVRTDWDRLIRKYHDLGTTYYLPHRATLKDKNNVPVGTSDTQSFSALDVFYDKVTKKIYIDVAWRQDCKILQEETLSVAY